MISDLGFIKQLEKEINRKLKHRDFIEINRYGKNGFTADDKEHVTGLNLDVINLKRPLSPLLSKFTHLQRLRLTNNKLTDIHFLHELKHLEELYLHYNQIVDISSLQGLEQLKKLYLQGNQIIDINSIRGLDQLEELYLHDNQISDISSLQGLEQLKKLYLNNNQITDIASLQGLSNLEELDLSFNQIIDITSLQGLKSLKKLNLRHNKITQLPETVVDLGMEINVDTDDERETGLQLKDNPLEKPPLEITRKGKKAIEAYYRSLEGQKHSLNEVKILLVGDGGAGKTSLVKRLLEKRFNKKEPQTHGINIDTWKIKVKKSQIIVRIWDFGGQEIMHATHQFFLSKRSLYILVLDGRKDEKTEYWLRHIESFGGDSPALVVINKIDENPGFDVNRPFLQQKYKNIKGFYRVSCADKMGIAEFSKALGDALSQVEMLRTTWSISWFKVKMELEYMKEDYISYDQYDTICREHSVIGYDSQTTLVDFLNDLGIVLHFNDPYLKETSVINPRWITEAVYRIINSRELADNKGILNKDDLDGILDKQKYPVRKHDYIIELMKKFELCFSLDDCTVLIPDLLDVSEPRFDFDYDASLKFLIQYDFLPRSVIARFIVRMHKDIKGKFRWRTGVVLKNEAFQATAVIKADEREKKIYIYVSGEQKQYYFAVIRHTFRDINGSYEKLGVSERVPVPGDLKVTVGYDHLIKVKKSGENYFFPEGAEKKYNIDDLLSGFEEDKSSSIALNINRRKSILDNLDNLIFDNSTCEKEIHNILENNLWILGTEYSRISSNETLKKTVEGYLGKKFRKDSSKKRPDLLLAEDINRCYLLIELKRPNHSLNRDDETQALKYRDELNVELHNVKINIILMGGRIINNISSQNERPDVKYLSYKDVISNARNNLKWLISDLR